MKKVLLTTILALLGTILFALGLSACAKKKVSSHVHSYGEWVVTVEPTCTQDGEKTRECKRCGAKIDEKIPVKPTNHYIEEGKDTTVCSGCDTELATSMTLEIADNGKSAFLKHAEGTAVIVPALYHDLPVITIGSYAFCDYTSLTSINIPDSVTSIGSGAIWGCTSLESITIPDSVNKIAHYAFCDCTSLTNINIPNSVTDIGVYAFCDCDALTSITISDNVTSIGHGAFFSCGELESVTIGNGVTDIGSTSFSDCIALTSVTFKNTAGWKADVTAVDVTNTANNAEYLRNTYSNCTWRREG